MDEQLKALLAAWLSDEADPESLAPLLERLEADEEFRRDFVAEILLMGQLKVVQASEPRWLQLEDAIGGRQQTADLESCVMAAIGDIPRTRPWPVLVAAAALILTVAIWLSSRPIPPPAPTLGQPALAEFSGQEAVAVLRVVQAADIAEGEILPGPLRFESGIVHIDFFSGVRMLLRGPADIQVRSATEVYIRQGEASCFVSELGRGFRVLTAHGEVIDLGTAFGIRVHPNQASEVHVFEGEVSVRPTNASKSTDLSARQAVRLSPQLRSAPFSRAGFPSVAEIASHAQARYDAWLAQAATLSNDPDVLLHCTFEGQAAGDCELRNQATGELRSSHGAIIGSRWSQGRWPMKSGLLFRSNSDRVLFKVPGSYRQLTLLVWLRIDALPNEHHALLLTEPLERWSIHGTPSPTEQAAALARHQAGDAYAMRWTVRRSGDVNFGFLQKNDAGQVLGSSHGIPRVTTPEEWGRWRCLAIVYDADAGTVRSYLDGEETMFEQVKYRGPVHLDFMELGNLSLAQIDKERNIRYRFHGAFDELLVAKRAMNAEEIAAIYALGAPE
jgi:hypothetical protein